MRYIAVDRDALRPLLFEDGPLSDLLLSTFIARREALQQVQGIGLEIDRPALVGGDDADGRVRPQQPAAVHLARLRARGRSRRRALVAGLDAASLPLVRLPGGVELRGPSTGQVSRALGIGRELAPREEVDLVVSAAGLPASAPRSTAPRRGSRRSSSRGTALGGQAGTSRRIENYLGFPAGISGSELTSRAVTQARKFDARTATPYRALSLEPGNDRHVVRLEEDHEIAARAVLLATGAQYRRLPVDGLSGLRGGERVLRGRPAGGAALRRLARRRGRRRQLRRARPPSGWPAAARS